MQNAARESKPYVREATREDYVELASRIRKEDHQEITHATGLVSAELNLLLCYRFSRESYAIVRGDTLIAIFGVAGSPGQIGVPWMLATDALATVRKQFLRECRLWLRSMLQVYKHLENYVWSGNALHIQWLRWLGFTIEDPVPFGADDQPFHHFYMKEDNV